MRDAYHCSGPPVSEMTYTMSSGTLNSTIPYHTVVQMYPIATKGQTPAVHAAGRYGRSRQNFIHWKTWLAASW